MITSTLRKRNFRSSRRGAAERNPTRDHEVNEFNPWPHSVGWGSGVAMSCGVCCRQGSDPTLLWLWYRQAAAVPIQPLVWELPYDTGAALKS